jgi:hypothetical protein
MTELLYSHSSVIEILKVPILMTVCISLIPIVILILKKKLPIEKSSKKEVRIVICKDNFIRLKIWSRLKLCEPYQP